MAVSEKNRITVQEAGEILVSFAIDREDLKQAIGALPKDQALNGVALDYELQLLKIVSVGWSVSVYMEGRPEKEALSTFFWRSIHALSKQLSALSGLTIGQEIDYFQVIRERLDSYLRAITLQGEGRDIAALIGAAFAERLKERENPFVLITGSRIFHMAAQGVREYLASLTLE